MNLTLPPAINDIGQFSIINPEIVVIIGANGSGKTRLGTWIERNHKNTHRISAQRTLNMPAVSSPTEMKRAESGLFYGGGSEASKWGNRWRNRPELHLLNDFSQLLTLLHTEEYEKAIQYKEASRLNRAISSPQTKLDTLQEIWERILPHRRLIKKAGIIETSIPETTITYPSSQMSDGERVIFYLIGQALCAPMDSLIIIDEPENHVHKAVHSKLWNEIENIRPDCTFLYLTHEIDFAVSRANSCKIWAKGYKDDKWEYELIENESNIPEHIYLEILGSRKDILFIEGEKSSIDYHLYREVYKDKVIEPLGGCSQVMGATKTFNIFTSKHRLNATGLIDKDRKSEVEIAGIRAKGFLIPNVAEVENFFLIEEIVKAIAILMNKNPDQVFSQVKINTIQFFREELERQCIIYTKDRLSKISESSFDKNFASQAEIEIAKMAMVTQLDVNNIYLTFKTKFEEFIATNSYPEILKNFNNKGIIYRSDVASLCGLLSKNYIPFILAEIKKESPTGLIIISTIKSNIL